MNVWEVGREEELGLLTFGMDSARRHLQRPQSSVFMLSSRSDLVA